MKNVLLAIGGHLAVRKRSLCGRKYCLTSERLVYTSYNWALDRARGFGGPKSLCRGGP